MALNADGNMPYDICEDERTLSYIETQMDRIGITQEMIDSTRMQVENQMLRDLQKLVKKSLSSSRSIDDILSYRNSEGATPLHIASANGYQSVVRYLLDQHVSLNLQDADGWTPTHAAAFWCLQPILSKLVDRMMQPPNGLIHSSSTNRSGRGHLRQDPRRSLSH